jgi:ABC-2 type transport system ATP-binding protein
VLATRQLGRTAAATVLLDAADPRRQAAARAGLDVGPLPLQDLFIALTSKEAVPCP